MLKKEGGGTEERKRIGDLLLEAGLVSEKVLQAALEEQEARGGRLCYNLIRMGAIRADDLIGFLRDQFGVAAVNLDDFRIEPTVLGLIPADFARREGVMPLHVLNKTLTVAMVDPGRRDVVDRLEKMTGLTVDPLISPEASLEDAVTKYYGAAGDTGIPEAGEGVLTLGGEMEEKHLSLPAPPEKGYPPEEWLKRFFLQAIRRRSREIHLEAVEEGLRARFRVEGRLEEGETVPVEMRRGIIRTALALARIDARGSASSPMEGRLKLFVRKRGLRATLSSFPTLYGERLVIKIMDESLLGRDFQELGMSKQVSDEVARLLHMRNGVFLVNAPPGQGKTTTFYSLLNYLRDQGDSNIMTLEHPIQYPLENISQTQVSFGGGVDFYFGLKSLLRQNPDVAGLTDISDCRTLEMVFTAARQCLVIGLCGFWDNLQAVEWIRSCGVSPASQAGFLRGLLVQRVLPRICSHCREKIEVPSEMVAGVRDKDTDDLVFYSGQGCRRCGKTGRSGHLGIFELLSFRYHLRDLLARGSEQQIIYEEAQRQGMWTLQEDGITKASQGLIDVRDVLEATREEGEEE